MQMQNFLLLISVMFRVSLFLTFMYACWNFNFFCFIAVKKKKSHLPLWTLKFYSKLGASYLWNHCFMNSAICNKIRSCFTLRYDLSKHWSGEGEKYKRLVWMLGRMLLQWCFFFYRRGVYKAEWDWWIYQYTIRIPWRAKEMSDKCSGTQQDSDEWIT